MYNTLENLYIAFHILTIVLNCFIVVSIDKKIKNSFFSYLKYFIFSPIILIVNIFDAIKYLRNRRKK